LDILTNKRYFDEQVCHLLGIDPATFNGTPEEFFDVVHSDDRDMIREALARTIEQNAMFSMEYRVVWSDRSIHYISARGNLVHNDADRPVRINGVSWDITERRQAEEERQGLQERLQRAEKMEALGTLAGGVAHDLNNVLGIIVGYAEMLLLDEEKSSPRRPSLVHIQNGGQRAAAIVQDLLTLTRRGVSNRKVLNLNQIIVDCRKSPEFKNLSTYHPSVKISSDLEPDLLNISGSSVHLGKTLFNLISNASEAMPNGGIVTIKTANQYLDKPIRGYDEVREGDYVVLSVSDTGEGIPAADLKRIFEPFYTKKVMGRSGTGLGLAVVWGTVKDHNGYINVQSEEGKGSVFTLYFPVTREDITAEAAAISMSEYMGNGESILIVDDIRGQRDLAVSMLRKLNYNVSSVSSGEEAITYLKDRQTYLLVLDMIMDPGMDGLDTYKKVLEIHPQQKAIIVSGYSESERVHAAQVLGAGAYVRKPYVLEKLGLAVRKELDRK
jgi:PAS domain S-box-containing protein